MADGALRASDSGWSEAEMAGPGGPEARAAGSASSAALNEGAADSEAGPAAEQEPLEYVSASEVNGSAFNLANSIIGAGILGLGKAFAWVGAVPAALTVAATYLMMKHTALMVVRLATHHRLVTYNELAAVLLGPRAAAVFMAVTVTGVMGALVAYTILIRDFSETVLVGAGSGLDPRLVAAAVMVALVLPMSLRRQLSDLTGMSAFSLLCVFSVVAVLLVQLGRLGFHPGARWFRFDAAGFARSVPIATFAFTCHLGILVHFSKFRARTVANFKRVTDRAFGFCVVVYLTAGAASYAAVGPGVSGNMLSSYDPHDPLVLAATAVFAISVALTYPVVLYYARVVAHQLLFGEPEASDPRVHAAETLLAFAVSLAAGLTVRDVSWVFGLVGSLAFAAVGIGIPALLFLRSSIAKTADEVWGARGLVAAAVFVAVAGSVATLEEVLR